MTTITKTNLNLKAKAALAAATALAAGSMMLGVLATPAHAAPKTFTVNTGGVFAGTGGCNATQCTLNEAILEANANPGTDTINFDIPDSGDKTITFQAPKITDPVIIDGYSQPGAQENTQATGASNAVPKIRLDGANLPNVPNGLEIENGGGSSTIRGLMITNWSDNGISIKDPGGVKLEGNFIGTDGTFDLGNKDEGVEVVGGTGSLTIGGSTPAARNVISANGNSSNTDAEGIMLAAGSNHLVVGNIIGTDKSGTADLSNTHNGILSFTDATIGGTPERANIIAFNEKDGVSHGFETAGILSNSIHSNGGLGIDLFGDDGQDPNDPGDGDTGGNGLQSYPVISSAKSPPKKATIVKGQLSSKPNQTYKVQFFSNPPNTDEGQKLVGQKSVTTDANGTASFTFKPKKRVKAGQAITATATDAQGNTSEFSDSKSVTKK